MGFRRRRRLPNTRWCRAEPSWKPACYRKRRQDTGFGRHADRPRRSRQETARPKQEARVVNGEKLNTTYAKNRTRPLRLGKLKVKVTTQRQATVISNL